MEKMKAKMRVKFVSDFHSTEMITRVKHNYIIPGLDVLSMLDYEIYINGDDKRYARRKLAQIKKELCGYSDCKCGLRVVSL